MEKNTEKHIIDMYKQQENGMILIFAQWCINNDLDPFELYQQAYPQQLPNQALVEAVELTVSKEEADHIPVDILFEALQLFGNDDLAFVVAELMEKTPKERLPEQFD
ncbi:hypothetical protein [Aquibacillus salsiterrae]|uniref:YxiS n=1 Tax=Aquibacillus salsiterrae TaxID=2950439 RepID=A0A9X3WC64_9BACI|nr:hypothetical protein [Aquibacillus salsiterrae]MDC3417065.1 hypothetical protein [Aquibacillus salsiterrae]